MTAEQIFIENKVQQYINMLNLHLNIIQSVKGKNTDFVNIQESYQHAIESSILKAKARIEEVKNGAVWDNLVIAFFGETNAGKSTIIETFRILFGEKERAELMQSSTGGVDGLIVGKGMSDCTQIYKEYKMNISGVPFTLIDVPGIEGNEGKYENEIKTALNRAHYVFYVQGQNKKPDAGTATKIKKYLRDWVKVYSIYNVRGVASNYDEVEERQVLLNESEKKIENQIKDTFEEILGETYMGNITIQAYLALCSKAKFAPERTDLQRGQNKLLCYFGDSDSVLSFSQFQSLINVVNAKALNFANEIVEASKEKHKALLQTILSDLKGVIARENQNVDELKNSISNFQKNIKGDFATSKRYINNVAMRGYDSLFDQVYSSAVYAIDHDVDDKEAYCKKRAAQITRSVTDSIINDISLEIKSLNRKIEERKRSLDQTVSQINLCGNSPMLSVSPSFGDALGKLDFSAGDFGNMVLAGIGAVTGYFSLVNFWNPLGWLAAVGTFLTWMLGGRNKEAEAKEEMRKQINKAKDDNAYKFKSSIYQICRQLDSACVQLTNSFGVDYSNIDKLQSEINSLCYKIQMEISKLKGTQYGTI